MALHGALWLAVAAAVAAVCAKEELVDLLGCFLKVQPGTTIAKYIVVSDVRVSYLPTTHI